MLYKVGCIIVKLDVLSTNNHAVLIIMVSKMAAHGHF